MKKADSIRAGSLFRFTPLRVIQFSFAVRNIFKKLLAFNQKKDKHFPFILFILSIRESYPPNLSA